MKRMIALVLSLVMALSLCAPAFAEGEAVEAPLAPEAGTVVEVSDQAGLTAALADESVTEVHLGAGDYVADLYNITARNSLTIVGAGDATNLCFADLQVRASQFKELTISDCAIGRMPNKGWGHLVFGSSTTAGGVYTLSNCTFNGVGSQGIYINQEVPATFNIEDCVFNGDFGGEGAITVQNNDGVKFTLNVTDCEFNNIPATSHKIFVHYAYDGWTLNVSPLVAEVDGVGYPFLEDAVAAGGEVKLLTDVTLNSAINVTEALTIDGNNKTLTMDGDKAFFNATGMNEGIYENLTVKNLKMVMSDATQKQGYAVVAQKGADDFAVSFTDCYFENMFCGVMLNGCGGTVAPAVTISGSNFKNVCYGVSFAKEDYAGKVSFENNTMTGETDIQETFAEGSGYLSAPTFEITSGTFSVDPTPYVAEGYKAVEGDGIYTVMETYNVTFDANGGENEYKIDPVVEGKFVLPANPFKAPVGKIFKAWSVDGKEYAAGASIDVAADVTVTAVWMNAPAPVEDTEVMVQVAPPEVTVSDKITGDALEIAQKVEVSEICTDAMTEVVKDVAKEEVTVKDEQVTDLADKLNTTAEAIEEEVVVVVQTNFEVEIQDVIMDDNGAAAVKLDITPVYQKVVTTETVVESGAKVEVGKNAVAIEDEDAKGELDLKGQKVEITISIPEALVNAAASNGNKLYVTHTKDNGTSFVYEATVDPVAKTATFENPNGFSSFTISATNSTVAYVKDSNMSYATIESAISDAGKGAVIEVLVSDQVVNITAPCSFKLKWADNITEPKINVAKGYTVSKWYVNGVYTYIVQSASAGGYAPSTTPDKVVTSADTFDAGIALYVGMSVMAAVGSAVVLKKRED